MAAPDDDRFVAGDAPITVADALARLSRRIKPVTGTRTVALIRAMGRYLAEDVVADRDVPPHDNSAVDGYAVRFADLGPAAEIRLAVAGRVAAGRRLEGVPAPGQAVQIFTGGAMPAGLDTVVMVEDCRREGSDVVVPAGVRQGANRRRAGEDVRAGRLILRNGRRLRATARSGPRSSPPATRSATPRPVPPPAASMMPTAMPSWHCSRALAAA